MDAKRCRALYGIHLTACVACHLAECWANLIIELVSYHKVSNKTTHFLCCPLVYDGVLGKLPFVHCYDVPVDVNFCRKLDHIEPYDNLGIASAIKNIASLVRSVIPFLMIELLRVWRFIPITNHSVHVPM